MKDWEAVPLPILSLTASYHLPIPCGLTGKYPCGKGKERSKAKSPYWEPRHRSWLPPSDDRLSITDPVALFREIGWLCHRRIFIRPGRSAHDALEKCREYVNEGYIYAISMDLQAYFDTVNHSKLIEVLSRTIKDGRVISLIHKYLKAGVMEDGGFHATSEGVPQGGPLSPLCGNVMLNELDKELERRGHKFVRYADDCIVLCKIRKSAERTLKHIIPYITKKLYLKVNLEKTTVSHVSKVKYLGYGFYRNKGKCRMRVHPKSIRKMKNHLRELTVRGNKWSNPEREEKLRKYATGWINYYRYADMRSLMETTDEWLRHRIRAVYWKQWKRVRTRYKMLRALHLPEWKVHEMANCRKGTWRAAEMLNSVLTKKILVDRLGYPSMTAHYLKVRVNY